MHLLVVVEVARVVAFGRAYACGCRNPVIVWVVHVESGNLAVERLLKAAYFFGCIIKDLSVAEPVVGGGPESGVSVAEIGYAVVIEGGFLAYHLRRIGIAQGFGYRRIVGRRIPLCHYIVAQRQQSGVIYELPVARPPVVYLSLHAAEHNGRTVGSQCAQGRRYFDTVDGGAYGIGCQRLYNNKYKVAAAVGAEIGGRTGLAAPALPEGVDMTAFVFVELMVEQGMVELPAHIAYIAHAGKMLGELICLYLGVAEVVAEHVRIVAELAVYVVEPVGAGHVCATVQQQGHSCECDFCRERKFYGESLATQRQPCGGEGGHRQQQQPVGHAQLV